VGPKRYIPAYTYLEVAGIRDGAGLIRAVETCTQHGYAYGLGSCHRGTRMSVTRELTVLPQALALCAFLAGSELALAQTVAGNRDAPVIAACRYVGVQEPSGVMSKPYTSRLSGVVEVGGPTRNAAASDCVDQSGWSWNLGGNTASCAGVIDALDPANKPALVRNTTQSAKASGVLSPFQVRDVTARDLKVPDATAGIPLALSDGCTVEQSEFMGEAFGHHHPYAVQDLRDPPVPGYIVDEPRWGVTLPRVKNVRDNNFIDHLSLVDDGHSGGRPGHRSLIWTERPPDPPR
jgi:hypothetical protein